MIRKGCSLFVFLEDKMRYFLLSALCFLLSALAFAQSQAPIEWLPPRLLSEAVSTGVAEGLTLEVAELKAMISGYYQARGLDENGFLTEAKLRELEIPALPEGGSPCQAMKPGACSKSSALP